jgi:hypothetical protein
MMRDAAPRKTRPFAVLALGVALGGVACAGGDESPAGPGAGGQGAGAAGSGASAGNGAGMAGSGNGAGVAGSASGSSGQAGDAALEPSVFESAARRLSRAELDNTVEDILFDSTAPAAKYLSEDEFAPFDNDYTLQRASAALIDSLEVFAEDAAARALEPLNRDRIVPCTPASAGDEACFTQTMHALGLRLFRRPLSSEEVTPYLALLAFATEDNAHVENDFYTAVELGLRSLLQDPEFLYRIEVGAREVEPGVVALTDHEVATRLAYLLWGSAPDAELLVAAGEGRLSSAGDRRAAAERLLDDQRARASLHRFHAMWLGYRAIPASAELVAAFNLETTTLIDRVVFDEPSSYLSLFTAPDTYLNDVLAEHYGLPAPAGGEGWVDYGDSGRAGILSHGSVLAAFGKFSDTSPTQRGIFVQTRLLCNEVLPPPANVNVDQPPAAEDAVCKIDRYAEHRSVASCAGCHAGLDPVGFGLEAYDSTGRFRTHDEGHPECLVSGEGELPGYGTFNGPGELAAMLVSSGELEDCFVRHFLRYAAGRALRAADGATAAALAQSFVASGYSAKELLLEYVASDRFAENREEPAP